jgi:hypothetical protein
MIGKSDRAGPGHPGWLRPLGALVASLGLMLATISSTVAAVGPAVELRQAENRTETNEAGGVTVNATWWGPAAGPVFTVVLDTHSVNLDAYDLAQLTVLRTEGGVEVTPIGWDAPSGGHHREGTLTFPETTDDGSPVVGSGVGFDLLIRGIAGVPERVLRWAT